jgi:hypothetical protein
MDGKAVALSSITMRDDGVSSDGAQTSVKDNTDTDGLLTTTFEPSNALSKNMELLTTR